MSDPRHHPVGLHQHKEAKAALNRFLELDCAGFLLTAVSWGGDPAKEITESMAMWAAALRWARYRRWSVEDPSIRVLVVGDGMSPRTGALVACLSKWSVTSVDPLMRPHHCIEPNLPEERLRNIWPPLRPMERLTALRAKVEDIDAGDFDLVLAVHSHAPVEATKAKAKVGGVIVSMPCCVPWPITDRCETWVDDKVLSPDRRIIVERRWAS